MNKEYSCDIIQDLLPGYLDGLLSEAGMEAVRGHIGSCENCRRAYEEMKEEWYLQEQLLPDKGEKLVFDGMKKVHSYTKRLKIALGMLLGVFLIVCMGIFLKIYVFGSVTSSFDFQNMKYFYDKDENDLVLSGSLNHGRVSRVEWKDSAEEANTIYVMVYGAETLPFLQGTKEFSVTIPDVKGKTVYLAGAEYNRYEVYNWEHDQYEILWELEQEIYRDYPEFDYTKGTKTDKYIINYSGGTEIVDGREGIQYGVERIRSVDDEEVWVQRYGDQIVTNGEIEPLGFEIWISLEEPHQIRFLNYETGVYSESPEGLISLP